MERDEKSQLVWVNGPFSARELDVKTHNPNLDEDKRHMTSNLLEPLFFKSTNLLSFILTNWMQHSRIILLVKKNFSFHSRNIQRLLFYALWVSWHPCLYWPLKQNLTKISNTTCSLLAPLPWRFWQWISYIKGESNSLLADALSRLPLVERKE